MPGGQRSPASSIASITVGSRWGRAVEGGGVGFPPSGVWADERSGGRISGKRKNTYTAHDNIRGLWPLRGVWEPGGGPA